RFACTLLMPRRRPPSARWSHRPRPRHTTPAVPSPSDGPADSTRCRTIRLPSMRPPPSTPPAPLTGGDPVGANFRARLASMGMLCAVSFNRYGRLYYFDPAGYTPQVGDRVLVSTDDGPEVAECVWAPQWVSDDTDGFPKLAGLAADEDVRRDELMRKRKAEAKVAAKKLIREHGLPMKGVAVDHVLDPGRPGAPRPIYL